MAVGSDRPKRRAASSNINYKETPETEGFEPVVETPKGNKRLKKSSSVSSTSSNDGKLQPQHPTPSVKEEVQLPIVDDSSVPWNWQPPFEQADYFSNHLDVKNCKVENGTLISKDGLKLRKNDCIYMVSEPPGDPYYIGRILGFSKKDKNLPTKSASNYTFKINWLYRPRDLSQKSSDSRLLLATMHSDTCPLQSYRGTITLKHRSEIDDFDLFLQLPNSFYFEKLFDRYMIKYYEILPTVNLVNLPPNYYKALNKRFPYVFVEIGRGKDLLSAPKNCEKCLQWCSSSESVKCLNCEKHYHMMCLDPPLLKKPLRGFGWSCALCNKKLESKLSKDRGQMLTTSSLAKINSSRNASAELDEVDSDVDMKEGEEENDTAESSDLDNNSKIKLIPRYEELAIQFLEKDKAHSFEQRRNLEEWPYRYLGMHVKLEDALDLQDRPYARSASRLGSKHQLTGIQEWIGHSLHYYDPDESTSSSQSQTPQKKKRGYNRKRASPSPLVSSQEEGTGPKLTVPTEFAKLDPSDYPPWLQERPRGYVERGGDETVTLMWKMPKHVNEQTNQDIKAYLEKCSPIAESLDLLPSTPNFMDAILKNYLDKDYDLELAYQESLKLTRDSLKEPTLTADEVARFEEGVRKFGSELYPVYQLVKTKSSADIVRFYYLWKKTPNGHKIWDNYEGRLKNKLKNSNKSSNGSVDNVADSGDDSCYDSNKIAKLERNCECKHCQTRTSVQWFRVTGFNKAPSDPSQTVFALCLRCAKLWRRYAVLWENPAEVLKKSLQKGGNGWKRRVEYELYMDSEKIVLARNKSPCKKPKPAPVIKKEEVKPLPVEEEKKTFDVKLEIKKTPKKTEKVKKKPAPKVSVSPPAPVIPPPKKVYKLEPPISTLPLFGENPNYISSAPSNFVITERKPLLVFAPDSRPCCVCRSGENMQDVILCSNCGLNVHKQCYGVPLKKLSGSKPWNCDRCLNDLNPIYSTDYSCVMCPSKNFRYDETLSGSQSQFPDLLKNTAENQWCHLVCALFDSDCKVGSLNTNSPIFNCKLSNHTARCTLCNYQGGSLTKCELCDDMMHVSCAQNLKDHFTGFFLQPCDLKEKACVQLQDFISGVPKPLIVCDQHPHSQPLPPQFVSLKTMAKRVNVLAKSGSQEQPLINLYMQDYKKNDDSTSREQAVPLGLNVSVHCAICHTDSSIVFIKSEGRDLCHSCYSHLTNANYDIEHENYLTYAQNAMNLMRLVSSALPVSNAPVTSAHSAPNTLISPTLPSPEPLEEKAQFNKIRINDILS